MGFAPFDVVLVPFPYADRLAEKRRPAVVISAPEVETGFGLVWLAMITSSSNPRGTCDVAVTDLKSAGLPAPSHMRPVKIATADAARVVRRIGKLAAKDANALKAKLGALLA